MAGLELGATLPDVELTMPDGSTINPKDYAGRKLVLYFYPKDDTGGCTKEAQEFSAHLAEFEQAGAAILGVSKDPPARHRKFIAKHDLTVPLASDEGEAIEALGVWVPKVLYGREYMGIDRSTWLFDASGTCVQAWRKVKVPGHVEAVLKAVNELN